MTRAVRASLVLLAATLAGCSSGSHARPTVPSSAPTTGAAATTSTTPPVSLGEATRRYTAADAALEAALAAPRARLTEDSGHLRATNADYQALVDAYRAFDRTLRAIRFPTPPAVQVRQLLSADATLELYLQAAAYSQSAASLASDQNGILASAAPQLAARNAVRQQLGLTPLKS